MTATVPLRPRPEGEVLGAPSGLPSEAEILGRAGGENFTVASRLLPAAARSHLLAIYGYARLVDQLGDDYRGDRMAALDWLSGQVDRAEADPGDRSLHPIVARIGVTIRQTGAGAEPLRNLIEANRQDQLVRRWQSFDDLVGYCRLSADPVGRLVLAAFGAADPQRIAWSDRICTALQLAEHWQDVAEDAAVGRVYVPAEDLERFEVTPDELRSPPAGPRLRALMAFEVARARRVMAEGEPLVGSLRGRTRFAVAGFVAGGRAALDAVADSGFDPFCPSLSPRPRRVAVHLVGLMCQRPTERRPR
jgi:squalene synthase HpnC